MKRRRDEESKIRDEERKRRDEERKRRDEERKRTDEERKRTDEERKRTDEERKIREGMKMKEASVVGGGKRLKMTGECEFLLRGEASGGLDSFPTSEKRQGLRQGGPLC
ncbi:hypothetical protein Pcinc_042283 [Petrolisthes cinctipes]|uniref:Uncharacterized protein n=1 Tax=Petrolisthes cinctipes TaxID=88211 RepID=A0AAE1EJ02_PETCI|nr:hypothetical protein Pcinc_042283 [Petrolisthes cinctipes]